MEESPEMHARISTELKKSGFDARISVFEIMSEGIVVWIENV